MVLPYIDYINFCLNVCNEKMKTKIQRMQNRALRICLRSTRYDRTEDLHVSTKLAYIDKRRAVDILKIFHRKVYKFHSAELSAYDYCKFLVILNNQHHSGVSSTRARMAPIIQTDTPLNEGIRKSLLFYGASLWNNLPSEIRNLEDFDTFKVAVKRHYYR